LILAQRLASAASRAPRLALRTPRGDLTYAMLDERAARWAGTISSLVSSGQSVAFWVDDPHIFIPAILGAWLAGCAAVPVDSTCPLMELLTVIRSSEATLLVSDRADGNLHSSVAEIGCRLLERPNGDPVRSRIVEEGDPALILSTSGTTGGAKCLMFTHAAMVRNIDALIAAAAFSPDDRFLSPLSPALTTVLATCVLPSLALGATLVLPGRFLPMQTRDLLVNHEISVFAAIPYVYHLLSDIPYAQHGLPSLRLCITNSAPMPASIAEAFADRFGLLPRSNYCSSEAGGITYNRATERNLLLSSVGTPLPGICVAVVDAAGRSVPAGVEGQVVVESSMTASGYLHQPELTKQVFREGRVWTDDLGIVDSSGYLYITGRLSATLNVAGHLVNPEEIEAVLLQYPTVAEALVIGEDDPAETQTLTALVVLRGEIDVGALRAFCLGELASYKVPRHFRSVKSLPRNNLGKLRRHRHGDSS